MIVSTLEDSLRPPPCWGTWPRLSNPKTWGRSQRSCSRRVQVAFRRPWIQVFLLPWLKWFSFSHSQKFQASRVARESWSGQVCIRLLLPVEDDSRQECAASRPHWKHQASWDRSLPKLRTSLPVSLSVFLAGWKSEMFRWQTAESDQSIKLLVSLWAYEFSRWASFQ